MITGIIWGVRIGVAVLAATAVVAPGIKAMALAEDVVDDTINHLKNKFKMKKEKRDVASIRDGEDADTASASLGSEGSAGEGPDADLSA